MAMITASPNLHRPSFFKVLVGDFTNKLKVPPAFVKNFKGWLPKIVYLKYVAGGFSWKIKMEETDKGYYFSKGWSEFVKIANLNYGEFIIFRMISENTFEVVIYGTTCCEKIIHGTAAVATRVTGQGHSMVLHQPLHNTGEADSGSYRKKAKLMEDGSSWKDEGANSSRKSNYLIRTLKKYEKSTFTVPVAYVKRFRLTMNKGIVLKDPWGRLWPVKLSVSRSRFTNWSRCYLTTGWSAFLRANNLVVGDTLRFQFDERHGNVVDIKFLDTEDGKADHESYCIVL